MALNPWQYAESTNNEHAHQVALFMFCGMAEKFGLAAAYDRDSYSVPGHALAKYGPMRGPNAIRELAWLHAIKNQGHGDKIRGNKSAAEGVRAGVPDTFLPVPKAYFSEEANANLWYAGLYVELKRPASVGKSKGSTSDEQDLWIEYLKGAGYAVEVCYGWEAARDCILKYLGLA